MEHEKPKVVDLFSGCGGMTSGFERAGFEVIAAYDNWGPAVAVYRENFAHPILDLDLANHEAMASVQSHAADVIVGGPPCQDFSIAGARNFTGKRANLTLRFAEIINFVRPKYFVMENVYNIRGTEVLNQTLKDFSGAGYGLTHGVFDASLMNVPQRRKRYFILGELGGETEALRRRIDESLSGTSMTVRDYLGSKLGTDFYYMHPRSYLRRGVFSVDEPSATIRGVNRPIPSSYSFHKGDAVQSLEHIRALTSAERSYLQTFPEDFVFLGAKTSIEQMIGNAVPVNMAQFIAERLMERILVKTN
jgi:DNA (cytosine-5)-methyltransferase 1